MDTIKVSMVASRDEAKEYFMLRDEITNHIKEEKYLSRFGYTVFATILGVYAAEYGKITPYIILIPLMIEVIIITKLRKYQEIITRAVAYIIVNLEEPTGIKWESSLYRLRYNNKGNDIEGSRKKKNRFKKTISAL